MRARQGMCECAVCLEAVTPGATDAYTLECSHTFHSACLIRWMRRADAPQISCPLCRGNLSQRLDGLTVRSRARYLRNTVARRRNPPVDLMRRVDDVRRAEDCEREARREMRDFRVQHKHTLANETRLRHRIWTLRRRVRERTRLLGIYSSPEVPLPPLVVGLDEPAYY